MHKLPTILLNSIASVKWEFSNSKYGWAAQPWKKMKALAVPNYPTSQEVHTYVHRSIPNHPILLDRTLCVPWQGTSIANTPCSHQSNNHYQKNYRRNCLIRTLNGTPNQCLLLYLIRLVCSRLDRYSLTGGILWRGFLCPSRLFSHCRGLFFLTSGVVWWANWHPCSLNSQSNHRYLWLTFPRSMIKLLAKSVPTQTASLAPR